MDFSTPGFQSRLFAWPTSQNIFRAFFCAAIFLFATIYAQTSYANDAESVRLTDAQLSIDAQSDLALNARVAVKLSNVLIDASKRGVPLYFVAEFELLKKRWYWFDDRLIGQSKNVRISYHAVTQQFRVAVAGVHQTSYPTLDEALSGALGLKDWQVATHSELEALGGMAAMIKKREPYEARLRVRLDSALLPKPLQINAITNKDWNLSSDWVILKLPEPAPTSQPLAPAASGNPT